MAEVIWPNTALVKRKSLARSGMMALPANQSEVHKNCAQTMTGNMWFAFLIWLIFFVRPLKIEFKEPLGIV